MRLIDEDSVMKMLTSVELNNGTLTDAKMELRNVKTAYDVEKVIAKLCWESHMPTTEDEDSWILLDDAIKIIRNGGKE